MDKFNRIIKKKIKESFEKFGFQNFKNNGTMSYDNDDIKDFIRFGGDHSLLLENYRGAITEYAREVKIISSFLKDLEKEMDYSFNSTITIVANLRDEKYNRIAWFEETKIGKDLDVISEIFKVRLIESYNNILFPIIEKQSDIHVLNAKYNKPFDSKRHGHHWFHKLIVAKLAGNTQYNDIYEYVITFFRGIEKNASTKEKTIRFGKWVEMIDEVHRRLKDVQPLENPYLGSLDLRNKVLGNQHS